MSCFIKPLSLLLHLISTGILAILFFMCVRAVMLVKELSWLKPFDNLGRGVVETVTGLIDCVWFRITKQHAYPEHALVIGVAILMQALLIFTAIAGSIK